MTSAFDEFFRAVGHSVGDDGLTKRERKRMARHHAATAGRKSSDAEMDALAQRMRSRIAPREERMVEDTVPLAIPRQPRGETFNALWMKVAEIRAALAGMGIELDDAGQVAHLVSEMERVVKAYPYGNEARRLPWAEELLRLSAMALSAYENVAYRE